MKIRVPEGVQGQWLMKVVGIALLVSKNHLLIPNYKTFLVLSNLARLNYK